MANEIQANFTTGKTLYALVRNSVSLIWNGATFESYLSANYSTYIIQMTEQGTSPGFYVGTFPPAIGAGVYGITAHAQNGGSPVETDPPCGVDNFQWNGTTVLPLSNLATSGQLAANGPVKIYRGE